jgi:hypothetical protein
MGIAELIAVATTTTTADLSPFVVAGGVVLAVALLWILLVLRLELNMALTKIPATPTASLQERLLFGHAMSALRWRREGGVQGFLRECQARAAKREKVFWFRLGPFHANVVIGDAESARVILGDLKQERYRKGFLYDSLRVVVPRGLTNTEGEDWRNQRHLITPVFHAANLDAMLPLMQAHVSDHLAAWEASHANRPIDIHRLMATLTLQVCRAPPDRAQRRRVVPSPPLPAPPLPSLPRSSHVIADRSPRPASPPCLSAPCLSAPCLSALPLRPASPRPASPRPASPPSHAPCMPLACGHR